MNFVAAPEDLDERLIFADWLEDRGRHDEAEAERQFVKNVRWNFAAAHHAVTQLLARCHGFKPGKILILLESRRNDSRWAKLDVTDLVFALNHLQEYRSMGLYFKYDRLQALGRLLKTCPGFHRNSWRRLTKFIESSRYEGGVDHAVS